MAKDKNTGTESTPETVPAPSSREELSLHDRILEAEQKIESLQFEIEELKKTRTHSR